jgi:acetyl esterase/lipase
MGYRSIQLDVRVPRDVSNPPLVLWIHGGAWLMGDRRYLPETFAPNQIFDAIINAGMAVATIDYRHSMEAAFPAQIHDVKSAIRYLKKYAPTFGFNPEKIGVMGESAGAFLAVFAAFTRKIDTYNGKDGVTEGDHNILTCVDWYGAADFTMPERLKASPEEVERLGDAIPEWYRIGPERLMFRDYLDDLTYKTTMSPARTHFHDSPPILIMHGDADQVVNIEHSNRLIASLHSAGIEHEYEIVEGANHIWMGATPERIAEILDRSVSFLKKHLA